MKKKQTKSSYTRSDTIKSIFFSGLFALLPLAITVALITFVFRLVNHWLEPLNYCISHYLGITYPYIAGIILVLLFILFVGTILRVFLLRTVARGIENMIASLPIIRPVYTGVKQLIHAFNFKDELSFKNVVLVQFPRKGMYSVGFVTSELSSWLEITDGEKERYYNIFIPTTPNPTSGFFIIARASELQVLDITRQEAIAMIISGGIIQPKRDHTPEE
jgi:uncharacterized membrane protein